MALENIVIKGARQHNLKDIDLTIPRHQLVVITGLSGSGKSSLAFDTIYAEGQRRYVESLSAYARQFLGQMDKPDVDLIEGLSPAIAIEQKSSGRNPRSTVGTVTEVYDYLRLLYARVGHPHCPQCGRPIQRQTVQEIVDQVLALSAGERLLILAPVVSARKGEYKKLFEGLKREGYVRVRVDGKLHDLDEALTLDKQRKHDIEVVVDRLVVGPQLGRRLADSLETALKRGEGTVLVHRLDRERSGPAETKSHQRAARDQATLVFSERYACPDCGLSFEELEPRMFSFNSPQGACPACTGLGVRMEVDPELVIDPERSLREGAVLPWNSPTAYVYQAMLTSVGKHFGFSLDLPWKRLKPEHRRIVLYGSGEVKLPFTFKGPRSKYQYQGTFEGAVPRTQRIYSETDSEYIRDEITDRYMRVQPCQTCRGLRLKPESLAVTVGGRHIIAATQLSVGAAQTFFAELKLSARETTISRQIVKEIRGRLGFLADVGLDYLTLDRATGTLSGGEAQRIHLATQIGSSLVGVLYILDEPSIGLHQRDNQRLLNTLKHLRDLGNTVLVVEHDEDTMRQADHLIDMGPGAGVHGGEIVVAGRPEVVIAHPTSLTGQYLRGALSVPIPSVRRVPKGELVLTHATTNNLKDLTVRIPLGTLLCVTGVSGSGKSSLVQETLEPALRHAIYRGRHQPEGYGELQGAEQLDKVIDIDQSPIGRTPRSNPATYTGVFDEIRTLFASTPEAKVRGYKPGRFSFNVKGGRCEACDGDGIIRIEMNFLPDVYVPCEVCKGKRYNRETLEVHYKGKTVAEVLDMIVDEALAFFGPVPKVKRLLQTVSDVGLGYIKLGQSATTLSGGEAQRLKLSAELGKRATGRTLYILDEPTTGLHFADVSKLLEVLARLVDAGNTVVVVEHNLDVVKSADFVLDLGPEGGGAGGQIVAFGRPEEVSRTEGSYTGQYLDKVLKPQHPPARNSV